MKKGNILFALVSSLLFGTSMLQAQSGLKKANNKFQNLAYSESKEIYEKISKRGKVTQDILKNIGDSYYFNGEYKAAHIWYNKLIALDTASMDVEYLYRYGHTLKNIGELEQANIIFEKFVAENPNSIRAEHLKNTAKSISQINRNSGRYNVSPTNLNSAYTDYPNQIHEGKLLFTSARDTGSFSKKVFSWTGDSFTKLYQSNIDEQNISPEITKFSKNLDSKFNESSAVLTKDGKTIYFTRNNYNKGKRGYNDKSVTLLKIYKAELKNGKWTNVVELPFNSDEFSTAHPVLNPNEDTLYFVSDRPGGYGSSDIWRVSITEDGFGTPENLGATINTEGRETFPFINTNNELYFSSDGRVGLGGLDIYAVKIKPNGSFSRVLNIGTPINSAYDDFAYIVDYETKKGYFASNRLESNGKDDIYSFTEEDLLEFEGIQKLNVSLVDSKSNNVINNASLQLIAMDNNPIDFSIVQEGDRYVINSELEIGDHYNLVVNHPDYETMNKNITINSDSEQSVITFLLDPKSNSLLFEKDQDLMKLLNLRPILFDFDKSKIRPDAAIELAKIVAFLNEYPDVNIDVRSFTDSRGPAAYNIKLSERRAKATAQWIISKGINAERISYKGYGETQLLNDCKSGKPCSEKKHAENRRSEFIVQ